VHFYYSRNTPTNAQITKKVQSALYFFLVGEGPRSRCYGRTAALRLIVQPCDEDEDDDEQFFTKFYE
jgi:hypothetical protein